MGRPRSKRRRARSKEKGVAEGPSGTKGLRGPEGVEKDGAKTGAQLVDGDSPYRGGQTCTALAGRKWVKKKWKLPPKPREKGIRQQP